MATIKDIALEAGVSATTVSLVLNGRAQEKNISQATAQRVLDVARDLRYRPSISARRLRRSEKEVPTLAFFWPIDYRANIMGYFLMEIASSLKKHNFDCQLQVQPYSNNHINEVLHDINSRGYSGAIIGATSVNDLVHLENVAPDFPVVLMNRTSNKYSTVGVDDEKLGLQAAMLLYNKGCREIAVMRTMASYLATGRRIRSFLLACEQFGIRCREDWMVCGDNSIQGGYQAALELCQKDTLPQLLFCESDAMAQGALSALHKQGVQSPEDMEILCIAMQAKEATQYCVPSLSTVALPSSRIVEEAVKIIQNQVNSHSNQPQHIMLEPEIILRETFSLGADQLIMPVSVIRE